MSFLKKHILDEIQDRTCGPVLSPLLSVLRNTIDPGYDERTESLCKIADRALFNEEADYMDSDEIDNIMRIMKSIF